MRRWVVVMSGLLASVSVAAIVAPNRWAERLEALDPQNPLAYFDLAEEVADDAAGDGAEEALARRLFAIAGTLDQEGLGAGACLGILQISLDEPQRRRVEAILELVQEDRSTFLNLRDASVAGAPESVRQGVGVFLSQYRSGRMRAARRHLEEPGVRALMEARSTDLPAGVEPIIAEVAQANRDRVPRLTEAEIIAMLQMEASLHGHDATTWSGDATATGRMPLMVIEHDALMKAIGEDRVRPLYRGGRWVQKAGR